jgi:cellulose synthase/poly-beta-1,6-N-acetylglucosamine synthase-like glycosyltransferase/mono/diheme cytochrome c family protein
MLTTLHLLAGVLYALALLGLLLYGLNAYVMIALHWRTRRSAIATPPPPDPPVWPLVTVQLPLYNERYVAGRLLEAAGTLDYPADRLEIQVLDDSTDDTAALVAETAERLRARGVDVVHLRRAERTGFKAGALAAGLASARGEFVAIFDADFVPPRDFLRRTVPHFADGRVAVVQTRWGHLNRDFSLLTVAQALGIDGHFGVEQAARCRGHLLLNFNGTAGVWRRAAIEDAGGWAHDTLTEDLDLSYRAQLRRWRILYLPELVCPAELPVVISGFKSQQRRWAKGSIQTARKLLPQVLSSPLGLWTKYQAFVHLTYYMIHPLMLVVVLLSVPALSLGVPTPSAATLGFASVVFALASTGPACMLIYAQRVLPESGWRRALRLPTIMVIGVGLAWSTSLAVLSAFWGRDLRFVRTPKFGIGPGGGQWRGKGYAGAGPWGGVVELALGLYCAWTAWLVGSHGLYGVLPFMLLYTAGFLTVAALTMLQATPGLRGAVVLVALGSALMPGAARATEEIPARSLSIEGERWWTRSPDATNPVACATCHHDLAAVRGWAAGFPKVKPFPPPHTRVMTLLQANAEAVARHYRRPDPLPMATAITAYLTELGAGLPVSPGVSPGQPVFPERIRQLEASVDRGASVFIARCGSCHRSAEVAPAVGTFPRGHQALETFLAGHRPSGPPLDWAGQDVADVVAYLVARMAGRPVGGRPAQTRKEIP